mmetsp:Transcript_3396/g.8169  ORF Transcript_3396/g.8169 Transcript_3396/m.8169 type:complete len:262 (-) Transcript_3396:1291-2076(-)
MVTVASPVTSGCSDSSRLPPTTPSAKACGGDAKSPLLLTTLTVKDTPPGPLESMISWLRKSTEGSSRGSRLVASRTRMTPSDRATENEGGASTADTVRRKGTKEVSTPPSASPPSSWTFTKTRKVPERYWAGCSLRVPFLYRAKKPSGGERRPSALEPTADETSSTEDRLKSTTCEDSPAPCPLEICVAKPSKVVIPEFSLTTTSKRGTKEGAVLLSLMLKLKFPGNESAKEPSSALLVAVSERTMLRKVEPPVAIWFVLK